MTRRRATAQLHTVLSSGLILGTEWDAEEGSLFSANATGDDTNNIDDEDGVILARPLVAGSTNNRVSVTASQHDWGYRIPARLG